MNAQTPATQPPQVDTSQPPVTEAAYPRETPHPLLLEFMQDMQQVLGENWPEYRRDVADLAPHWPTGKVECAEDPAFARTYMLDTAKSAADLLLLWLQLRRVAQQGEAQP